MPLFEITKPMTATFIVECESAKEAMNWADKIVADIQDENGESLESKEIISFKAETNISEIEIKECNYLPFI